MDNTHLLIAILIPLLSGATILAYNRPEGYAELHSSLDKMLTPVFFIFAGYCFGSQKSFREFFIFAAVVAYLVLLKELQRFNK